MTVHACSTLAATPQNIPAPIDPEKLVPETKVVAVTDEDGTIAFKRLVRQTPSQHPESDSFYYPYDPIEEYTTMAGPFGYRYVGEGQFVERGELNKEEVDQLIRGIADSLVEKMQRGSQYFCAMEEAVRPSLITATGGISGFTVQASWETDRFCSPP